MILDRFLSCLLGGVLVCTNVCLAIENPSTLSTQELAVRIMGNRPGPLERIDVQSEHDVSTYGAIAGDGKDDLPAVRKAFEAAIATGKPARIIFPKGDYDLYPRDKKTPPYCFLYKSVNGLEVQGQGSTIRIHHTQFGFARFDQSKNLIFKAIDIRYPVAPFTQCIVKQVNRNSSTFVLQTQPGFEPLDAPQYAPPKLIFIKDPQNPSRQKKDVDNYFRVSKVKKIDANLFELTLKLPNAIGQFRVDDKVIYINRGGSATGSLFGFFGCQRVRVDQVTADASPGCGVICNGTSELSLTEFKLLRQSGRWATSNSDGVHCQAARVGPWIENCVFEAMHDDALNVYSRRLLLEPQDSQRLYAKVRGNLKLHRVGDQLRLFNPRQGIIAAETWTIKAIDLKKYQIELDKPLPENLILKHSNHRVVDAFYNINLSGFGTVVRGNVFRDIRGRGLLLKVHDSLIENNQFQNVSNQALVLSNNQDVPEGLNCQNVVIRGNTITDCGMDLNFRRPVSVGNICVSFLSGANIPAMQTGHQNIRIENNTINQWRRTAIFVGSTDYVTIKNNLITNNEHWTHSTDADVPIRLMNTQNENIDANVIEGSRKFKQQIERIPFPLMK